MMMTLTGLILAMLGVITAIHSDHQVIGILLLFGGVTCVCMRGCQNMSDYNWCHGPKLP